MQKNYKKCGASLLALLLLGMVVLALSSCGQTWNWLWSRDDGEDVDTNRFILGGEIPEGETELIFV